MEIDYRPLEIEMLSAKDLANMNCISKMDVYIVSSISSDRRSIERTPIDKKGGTNPKWKKFMMKFYIDESAARLNQVTLMFQIISRRVLGDRTIGFVQVPVKALLDEEMLQETEGLIDDKPRKRRRLVSYQVRTLSGKTKGTLCFMYSFGETFKVYTQSESGHGYGNSCHNCTCNYSHLPIMYNGSYGGPKHQQLHEFPSSEYPGINSIGHDKKRRSCFGLSIIFKFLKALFRPVWVMPRPKVNPY